MIALAIESTGNEQDDYPRTGRPTALVVDNVASSRRSTADALECCGFQVFTAGSAKEVNRVTRRLAGPLDLLVTEVALPDVRGDVLARWVRRKGLRARVLYLSDRTYAELQDRGFTDRRAPLVRKPVDEHELARWVREALGF